MGCYGKGFWTGYSSSELAVLANTKRLLERWSGDDVFRSSLGDPNTWSDHCGASERNRIASSIGCEIDVGEVAPLIPGYRCDSSEYVAKIENGESLVGRWIRHISAMIEQRTMMTSRSFGKDNPAYDSWRKRQILRVRSELGDFGSGIVHPLVAFELSSGCSVGCWFCGISAEKFKGVYEYNAHSEAVWRGILQAMVARFGSAMESGFCYWATDPLDNPNYAEFIKAYYEECGCLPQTTTAIPMRDPTKTREILGLFEACGEIVNRFSITTIRSLRSVHEEFSAEELLGVELVLQNKEAFNLAQSSAGRAYGKTNKGEQFSTYKGTIACVSGFIINMVEGTIKLVSPTHASEKWPDGYITFDEARFYDVRSFSAALDHLTDAFMTMSADVVRPVSLRGDLNVERTDRGIVIKNEFVRQLVNVGAEEAELLKDNLPTAKSILDYYVMGLKSGERSNDLSKVVSALFDLGFVTEIRSAPTSEISPAPALARPM